MSDHGKAMATTLCILYCPPSIHSSLNVAIQAHGSGLGFGCIPKNPKEAVVGLHVIIHGNELWVLTLDHLQEMMENPIVLVQGCNGSIGIPKRWSMHATLLLLNLD